MWGSRGGAETVVVICYVFTLRLLALPGFRNWRGRWA